MNRYEQLINNDLPKFQDFGWGHWEPRTDDDEESWECNIGGYKLKAYRLNNTWWGIVHTTKGTVVKDAFGNASEPLVIREWLEGYYQTILRHRNE